MKLIQRVPLIKKPELLKKGTSSHLVIPGASEKAFGGWDRKFGFPSSTRNVTPDSPGASTFEDTLLAAGVIQKNGKEKEFSRKDAKAQREKFYHD